MPVVLLGIPAAIALAWFALRGGRGRKRGDRTALEQTADGGPLEPGSTLRGREPDKPFERHELEYAGLPYMYGGEVGGPYGPESQAQAPSAPVEGYAEQPGPTQTYVMEGRLPAPGPTQWQGQAPDLGPTQWQGHAPTPAPAPAPAPAPIPMGVRRAA